MHRAFRVSVVLAVLAAMILVGVGSSSAARHRHHTPRWVKHVKHYPGGISNGVRAYVSKGVIGAQAAARQGLFKPSAPGNTGGIGGNVQVNTEPVTPKMPQNETAVAYSTDDPLTAVATSNDYIDGGLGIYTTHDGGNTWNSTYLTPRVLETGDFCSGGDPTVVYSARDHAFYAAQLCFMRFHPESEIQVIQSTDGGDHWTGARFSSQVITNFDPNRFVFNPAVFFDKELLAVDNYPASPFYGRLYITFIKFHMQSNGFGDYCPVQLAYTDDVDPNNDTDLRDTVWTHNSVVPDNPGGNGQGPTANQWAVPVVDRQGGLDISYASEDCNNSIDRTLLFKRSTNGGSSFGPQVQIDKPGQWVDNPNPSDLLPNKNARIPLSPSMDYDPQLQALVYVVQNNRGAGNHGADVTGAFSTDYGTTWSDMQVVSHQADGSSAPNDQFFPWVSVDNAGGIHVIWFDNRNDPGNTLIETFELYTTALDFSPANVDISTASWNPNLAFFASGSFIGDYNGLDAVDASTEYPIWTDGRNSPGPPLGQADIFTVPNS
ncbi:MAG: hypothetical protein M3Q23_10600 [Actinomycetota bacterium]|nr:hypothetical protein [Actinomycetota bacterium]